MTAKDKTLSLGKYPAVSIKDARSRRDEAKERIAKGIDPGEQKKLAKAERYTFEAAGERWYEHHAEVTVPATHKKIRMYLEILNKKIGGRALPELDRKQDHFQSTDAHWRNQRGERHHALR